MKTIFEVTERMLSVGSGNTVKLVTQDAYWQALNQIYSAVEASQHGPARVGYNHVAFNALWEELS